MKSLSLALAGLISVSTASPAHAWGAEGHRLIADLADAQLTKETRAEVTRLLSVEPGATVASVSTWADETRSPQTAAWHYVNLPPGDCSYEQPRDCPDGDCLVEALERQRGILKSNASDGDRLIALKWVIHLVGDIHQPLHAGFMGDKGGNLYQVRFMGRGGNLHSLWDSGLIRHRVGGLDTLRLDATTAGTAKPETSKAGAWAVESCKVVLTPGFYPDGRFIEQSYVDQWDPVLVTRLKMAAQRLAAVLNDALR